ncbi:MAG TPA: polysialyltransferase family glycosyltransferase [Candidatus Deferrimicrobiaceae bacterium]|nr:polysialyltransferase family glycosyltransferase [Candidatus Deferrimicrobiaceae bacterium]
MDRPGSKVNVFLVHTQFQFFITDHMIGSMREFSSDDNYLVLDMDPGGASIARGGWKEVIPLEPPVGGSVWGARRSCMSAMGKIGRILQSRGRASLFLSDIQWPLNNALYAWVAGGKGPRPEICNFPDGIANLQLVYPNAKQKAKNVLKYLLGLAWGCPYYPYGGDIVGLERSDRIYSLLPEAISGALDKEIVRIPPVVPLVASRKTSACLFVGQNYDYFMPRKEFRKLCEESARFTMGLGYTDHVYKPHPFESTDESRRIFEQQGFVVLDDNRSVEEVFLHEQYRCVVSHNSSCLAHLKLMFGDAVRCISFMNGKTIRYTNVDEDAIAKMVGVFRICGIEQYE